MVWLPNGEKSLRIHVIILTEYQHVMDRNGHTSDICIVRAMHTHPAVKH